MPRVAWLTDLHLDFVSPPEREKFLCRVVSYGPDAVLIGGDISTARDVLARLEEIDAALARPVFFVLGNHDYYGGSIASLRAAVTELCRQRPNLHYLTDGQVHELSPGVGLVGHDGWADARVGDYERSDVMLNDYQLIAELKGVGKAARRHLLNALGDEAAASLRASLTTAVERYPHAYLLTHVPPLREACWHEGQLSDDDWAPHFVCAAAGEAILEVMRAHPACKLTVLCGHTHSPGECQPLENVRILTGLAVYGRPIVQDVFKV